MEKLCDSIRDMLSKPMKYQSNLYVCYRYFVTGEFCCFDALFASFMYFLLS